MAAPCVKHRGRIKKCPTTRNGKTNTIVVEQAANKKEQFNSLHLIIIIQDIEETNGKDKT